MSTRLEIRTKIINDVFKRTDKDSQINNAINDTLKEMGAAIHPRKLQDQIFVPTVIGQEDYALPDTILRIRHPARLIDPSQDTNNSSSHHPLRFITKVEYDFWEPNPNAGTVHSSRPWGYTIWKNCLLLTDPPDKVYRIELNIGGVSVELSSDSDEMIFQEQWIETVMAGSLSRLYSQIQLYEDAKEWTSRYINGYAGQSGEFMGGLKAIKEAENDTKEAPLIVRNNKL